MYKQNLNHVNYLFNTSDFKENSKYKNRCYGNKISTVMLAHNVFQSL